MSMEQHSCLDISVFAEEVTDLKLTFSHQSAVFNTILSIYLHILLANFSVSCVANSYVSNDSFYVPHHHIWCET